MSDKGHELTDKKLAELEKKLKAHYKQASDEVEKKLDDYLKAFKAKDARHLADLQKDYTKENYEEYIRWRQGQVLISERWEEMRQSLAEDYHHANMEAKSIIDGYMPDIYALNHNYGTYDVEHNALVDTSYTLYDRQTVERLMRDDPDMLPPPGKKVSKRIAEGKDVLWNKSMIQSSMWQSITQGESMDKIAKRLAQTVGDKDMAAAVRNARTMTTGAECAGRVDSYKRAEDMGIQLQQEWMSTLDGRTRHSHRELHGERIDVDGTFSNSCRFPGDPSGPAEEIYNCRCTLVAAIKGFEGDKVTYSPKMGDMSFEEWVGEHEKQTNETVNNQSLDIVSKSGIIESERRVSIKNVDTGGRRNEKPLSRKQVEQIKDYASELGMPKEQIRYGEHYNTSYGSIFDRVYIGTDALPSDNPQSANSRLSWRSSIAHEIVGHRETCLKGWEQSDVLLDEIQASIRAARFAPGLTNLERINLLRDAGERAHNNGLQLKNIKHDLHIKVR